MAAKTGNRSPENSGQRGESRRHEARLPARTPRRSNLFPSASASRSCRTICTNANQTRDLSSLRGAADAVMQRWRLIKNRDEHRWYVLQEIFRFGVLEKCGVLLQFVCHLINDKAAAGRKRIVRFSQERTFLVDLENAERNA